MRTHHYCKHCWSWELCNLPGCFMSAWPLKTLVVNKEIQFWGTPRAVTTRILCTDFYVGILAFGILWLFYILHWTEYLGSNFFRTVCRVQMMNWLLWILCFCVDILCSISWKTSMATIWRNVRMVSLCSFSYSLM